MRVLWFTNTPSNYKVQKGGYNGGGWISSLENEINKIKDIELAISFILPNELFKITQNNVTYYPITLSSQNKLSKLKNIVYESIEIKDNIDKYIEVVNDFKPDIIEIFGSEQPFGLISKYIKIPIVLHIQGIINPYYNAFLPPFFSWKNLIFHNINPIQIFREYLNKKRWKIQCKQEKEILQNVKYYIGRTTWDERITKIFNQSCLYFYGSEILRDVFYQSANRCIPDKLKVITTISSPLYKGFDLVLKTAKIIKENLKIDFIWKVFGDINPRYIENIIGITCDDVNVKLMGVAQAETIKEEILCCTCFFHPSYIDNSPNSVCEAQILGCPVISTNVGGISSLINDNITGFLIPANDPYQAAYLIKLLHSDISLNQRIGHTGKEIALKRHDKQKIIKELICVYNQIL